jgi:hypothetical protein
MKGESKGRKACDLEIAKTILKKGLEIEKISEYTGIKRQELTSLSK